MSRKKMDGKRILHLILLAYSARLVLCDLSAVSASRDSPALSTSVRLVGNIVESHFRALVSILEWTEITIITDNSHLLSKGRGLSEGNFRLQMFTVPTTPTTWDITRVFDAFNERKPMNIFVFCSYACIVNITKEANAYDDHAFQQGYFSYTHKWIFAPHDSKTHQVNWKLRETVGIINNVLVLDVFGINELSLHKYQKEKCRLLTMVGQNVFPYFREVGFCSQQHLTNFSELFPNINYGLNNRHLIVTTNPWAPFVNKETNGLTVEYTGLCMDLLQTFSEILNFTYTLVEPNDGKWGSYADGVWNGLVADMQHQKADLMVAPLSRTPGRSTVMDFASQPFYIEPYTAMYRSPGLEGRVKKIFKPFRWEVWVLVAASIPLVAIIHCLYNTASIYLIRRYKNVSSLKIFSSMISQCLLDAYGAILFQGRPNLPRFLSGQLFWGCYWLFCIVMAGTYCGNLIAALAVVRLTSPFNSFYELVENNEFKFGTLGGIFAVDILRYAKSSPYTDMWRKIEKFNKTDEEVLGFSHSAHIRKVKDGQYVYILDRTSMELEMAADCSIAELGEDLDYKFLYSVGMRKNSAFQHLLGEVTLQMSSFGLIDAWKRRHWPQYGTVCSEAQSANPTAGLEELFGAFTILFGTIAVAGIILIFENSYYYFQSRRLQLNSRRVKKRSL